MLCDQATRAPSGGEALRYLARPLLVRWGCRRPARTAPGWTDCTGRIFPRRTPRRPPSGHAQTWENLYHRTLHDVTLRDVTWTGDGQSFETPSSLDLQRWIVLVTLVVLVVQLVFLPNAREPQRTCNNMRRKMPDRTCREQRRMRKALNARNVAFHFGREAYSSMLEKFSFHIDEIVHQLGLVGFLFEFSTKIKQIKETFLRHWMAFWWQHTENLTFNRLGRRIGKILVSWWVF